MTSISSSFSNPNATVDGVPLDDDTISTALDLAGDGTNVASNLFLDNTAQDLLEKQKVAYAASRDQNTFDTDRQVAQMNSARIINNMKMQPPAGAKMLAFQLPVQLRA